MGGSFTPDLKRFLLDAGCRFVRAGKGDHDIWFSPHTGVHFPVDQKIKSRHTANAVLKQAGLPKHFWLPTGIWRFGDAIRWDKLFSYPNKGSIEQVETIAEGNSILELETWCSSPDKGGREGLQAVYFILAGGASRHDGQGCIP